MIYIRKVRVEAPGIHSAHITHVQYSFATTGALRTATREQIVASIDSGHLHRSHNNLTGTEAKVITATSANGMRYITTVADGRRTNNLLALPEF